MELLEIEPACAVVELRQYTLHPGQRDVLIELFERAFVGPLEAAGMTVMGQFHDLDRPDRFVWMRGFRDMYRRAQGLAAFYGGPVWNAHREAANATMIDSDNVLLLRPAREGAGIALADCRRAPLPAAAPSGRRIVVTISPLARPADMRRVALFERVLAPALEDAGARVLGCYVTETSANTFPRLPVREGEHVFVWFASFADDAAYSGHRARLEASPAWRDGVAAWSEGLIGPSAVLRLAPTPRSLLDAGS
ncbi:MAG TPA: NIPSNAP family protein [Burkholderiaceae bacterium]|nr:NIPSNAP family protein [Burkholderiaceae bacterium]